MNRTPTSSQMPRQRLASRTCYLQAPSRCRSRQNLKRYFHRNQQYSVTAITDGSGGSGGISERYAYTAYGTPTITDASGTTRTTTAIGNRYTYTGREWDETLALYHYRARMYDSVAGRFVSRDPIGFEGGSLSFYQYVNGLPSSSIDPSGLVDINIFPPTDPLHGVANDHPDSSGSIIIGGHGAPDGTIFGSDNKPISTADLVDLISNSDDYKPGTVIVLKVCYPGRKPGNCQAIADGTGLPVVASDLQCTYYYFPPRIIPWTDIPFETPTYVDTDYIDSNGNSVPPTVYTPATPLQSKPSSMEWLW